MDKSYGKKEYVPAELSERGRFGVSASETRNGSSLFDHKVSFAVEMKYIAAYVGVNDFE